MRIVLITNPIAGGSSRTRIDLLEWAELLRGHRLEIVAPATPEETQAVVRQAVAEGVDRVLAAGGDGTVNVVTAGLAGTDVPLGILPMGTVNVLAREFGIPLDATEALQIALTGQPRRVDLGMANGQPFTLMAGMGFDAKVVHEVIPSLKELFGPLAYVTAGLQALVHYKPSQFHLCVDGIDLSLPAWLVIVGNAGSYTYQFAMAPDARMDDGMLDICLFAERTALDRITQIGAAMIGQHVHHPNVSYLRARRLRVEADPPVPLQLDGDAAGTSPVDISIRPAALSIIVPASRQGG